MDKIPSTLQRLKAKPFLSSLLFTFLCKKMGEAAKAGTLKRFHYLAVGAKKGHLKDVACSAGYRGSCNKHEPGGHHGSAETGFSGPGS